MTAPRTDPQSTVPVEPLSDRLHALEDRFWSDESKWAAAGSGTTKDQQTGASMVWAWLRSPQGGLLHLADVDRTLDAARASQPITATPTVEAGHNHTTAGLPTYPVCRGACPLGCDTPLPPTERVEVRPGEFLPRPRMAILDPFAEGEAIIAVKAAEAKERLILAALPVREDEPTGIDGALKTIRDLCDMDLEEQRAEFGSEQRVMHVVIPAVVNDALGVEPMSEGLRRVLFRLFSYIGEASHVR